MPWQTALQTNLHTKPNPPNQPLRENKQKTHTPPKFNMEPENDGFQKESPFPGTSFQVPC